jgi:hypothetical protein
MNIETLLYEAMETDFNVMADEELGSEKRRAAVDELTKLMDRAIEMQKVDNDCEDKREIRENEKLAKTQQFEDDHKDRLIKNLIGAAGIVLPLIVTIWGTKVSLKFEEEGTFTTIMGRGFIQKLLPRK